MLQKICFISVICLYTYVLSAQQVTGKIYADDAVLEGAIIENLTSKILTTSNKRGDFSIAAAVGDTLKISASFYQTQFLQIQEKHLQKVWVVELKQDINVLDEVNIVNEKEPEPFDEKEVNQGFNSFIMQDIKENPYTYRPAFKANGVDIIGVTKMLIDMIGGKKKVKPPAYKVIETEDLENLFSDDTLFNEELLTAHFGIPAVYHTLFFEYVAAHNLDAELLKEEK